MLPAVPTRWIERIADDAGNLVPAQGAIRFRGVRITNKPDETLTGDASAPGSVTGYTEIDLSVTLDGSTETATFGGDSSTAPSTIGGASKALATLSLPAGTVAGLDVTITAVSGSWGFVERGHSTDNVNALSGFASGYTPSTSSSFPIWPSVSISWSAGTLTFTGTGPKATIVNCDDNGSGDVRVTVSGGLSGPLSSTLNGQSVTISGVAGTTEANGTHVATRIDATNFDIPVAFVNAYTSGGQVVLATPPTVRWGGEVGLVAKVQ